LKLLRRITRTENILHRNFTRRQVAIQNRVASNIGISQSTFSVKVLNLFSRSRRKTNKRKSKHSAMLRNKRSEERFSRNAETDLVCRLLLEKKKQIIIKETDYTTNNRDTTNHTLTLYDVI